MAQARNIRIHQYLDDWLITVQNRVTWTRFYLCRIPVRLCSGSGQTHHREEKGPVFQNQLPLVNSQLLSQAFDIPDRSADGNG